MPKIAFIKDNESVCMFDSCLSMPERKSGLQYWLLLQDERVFINNSKGAKMDSKIDIKRRFVEFNDLTHQNVNSNTINCDIKTENKGISAENSILTHSYNENYLIRPNQIKYKTYKNNVNSNDFPPKHNNSIFRNINSYILKIFKRTIKTIVSSAFIHSPLIKSQIFRFLTYMSAASCILLFHNEDFYRYKEYCDAVYKHIPQKKDLTLVKLIVVHRHGDRAPVKCKESSMWPNEDCIKCSYKNFSIKDCKKKNCREGELTSKGYQQMVRLGEFIKNEYADLLDDASGNDKKVQKRKKLKKESVEWINPELLEKPGDDKNENNESGSIKKEEIKKAKTNPADKNAKKQIKSIKLRATEVGRTHSSLAGVYKGLTGEEEVPNVYIPKATSDSLINQKNCNALNTILNRNITNWFKEVEPNSIDPKQPQIMTDIYMTHICNHVDLNCKNISCDPDVIMKYIKAGLATWRSQTDVTYKNEKVLKLAFGRFAKELLDMMMDDTKLFIISAHDGSLSIILSGLKTAAREHPPYASAIFIELWKGDEYYVRILFNKSVCQTGIDDSTNIPLKKFIQYLYKVQFKDENEYRIACMY